MSLSAGQRTQMRQMISELRNGRFEAYPFDMLATLLSEYELEALMSRTTELSNSDEKRLNSHPDRFKTPKNVDNYFANLGTAIGTYDSLKRRIPKYRKAYEEAKRKLEWAERYIVEVIDEAWARYDRLSEEERRYFTPVEGEERTHANLPKMLDPPWRVLFPDEPPAAHRAQIEALERALNRK